MSLQVEEVEHIEADIISTIQSEIAKQYGIVPLYLSEGGIHFLASDPFNSAIIDDLTFALNLEIQLIVCDPEYVTQLINTYYPSQENSLNDLLGDVGLWRNLRAGRDKRK